MTETKNNNQDPKIDPTAPQGAEPTKEKVRNKEKEETVSLPAETLRNILSTIESLKESDKKKDEEIKKLLEVADKGRLARYESANQTELIRTARVSFWEGCPILAWASVRDEVGFRNGRVEYNQTIKIIIEKDGQIVDKELEYLHWTQNVEGRQGEVISKTEEKGKQIWTIRMSDGQEIKIDVRFLNAF